MARILLTILSVVIFAACTRNPEGAERRRANPRPAPEAAPETTAAPAPSANPLPEGHPPLDQAGTPAPAGGGGAVEDGARAAVAGVRWEAPPPFRFQRPSSSMRAAEYVIDGGDEATVMTVFFFPGGGGGIQANIDRWVGQMRMSPDRPAETTRTTVNELPVTKIDVYGGYGGMQGQEGGGGADTGFRMLAAIVEGPQGPVFFKLVGPEDTVNLAAEAFDGLIASFHAGG